MALLVQNPVSHEQLAIFIHVHKTGGSWVRKTLENLGMAGPELGGMHCQLAPVKRRRPNAFIFGFVRDPFEFLRSYFSHRHKHANWHKNRDLDIVCQAPTLSEFLDLYLEKLPGWVGRWYNLYVGEADFVGRTETLRQDLCTALDSLDLEYDRAIVWENKPCNVTEVDPRLVDLGSDEGSYRTAVREAETAAYLRWY